MTEEGNIRENAANWMELHINRTKLKTTSKISALLAGFAMVALIELSIEEYKNDRGTNSTYALTLYGIVTSVLIFLHIYSLMIATCILPDLDYIAIYEHTPVLGNFLIQSSPHRKYSTYVHVSWLFSNVLGNLCLLLDLFLILFIKFYPHGVHSEQLAVNSTYVDTDEFDGHFAPLVASVLVLGFLVFVYIVTSLHILKIRVTHKTGTFGSRINELQHDFANILRPFHRQSSTARSASIDNKLELSNKEEEKFLPKKNSKVILCLDDNFKVQPQAGAQLENNC